MSVSLWVSLNKVRHWMAQCKGSLAAFPATNLPGKIAAGAVRADGDRKRAVSPGGATPPIYQAQLFELKSMRQLMQDGPPNSQYRKTHDCSRYGFGAYTIDERGAYGSQQKPRGWSGRPLPVCRNLRGIPNAGIRSEAGCPAHPSPNHASGISRLQTSLSSGSAWPPATQILSWKT